MNFLQLLMNKNIGNSFFFVFIVNLGSEKLQVSRFYEKFTIVWITT